MTNTEAKHRKLILHIATDEKFIDAAYEIYEKVFPGINLFLILQQNEGEEPLHVSKLKPYKYVYTSGNYIDKIRTLVSGSDLVVFHGIGMYQAKIVTSINWLGKNKIWHVYGAEVYGNPRIINYDIYGKRTRKKYINTLNHFFKKIASKYYHRIFNGIKNRFKKTEVAIKEMDLVATLYDEEFSFYKSLGILNKDARFIKFTYYPLHAIINEDEGWVESDNILLGNSASYSNNHLEAFSFLKSLDLKKRKIITPLSYGNDDYANDIVKVGNETFGDIFCPLRKFYPLCEYQKIIQSCGIVIMNHYRQQAVGNILNTLHMGAKVYLNKKSTLFEYLKRIGCYIFSIEEDLKPENKEVFALLTQRKMEHNREILKKELSIDKIHIELEKKLSSILKNCS